MCIEEKRWPLPDFSIAASVAKRSGIFQRFDFSETMGLLLTGRALLPMSAHHSDGKGRCTPQAGRKR